MAFEGDLTNLGLADIFQTLGMNRQSGTLVVRFGETERRFYFADEGVSLLTSRSARKFRLGNLLVGMGKLSEGDLKVAVLKQERAKETKLGDILVQTGLVKGEDLKSACRYQAAEEIYESFSWKSGKFQFLEGANAGPTGGPGPFAEFFFPVTDVVMEAARRADEYALNLQKIGDPEEFYVRASAEPLPEEGHPRPCLLLHQMLDGTVDVRQAFEEFYLSPFDTSQAFVTLISGGHIKPMSPSDLKAAAAPFLERRDYPRASRLLARASRQEPRNAELLRALADAQAAAGNRKDAAATLTSLGRLLHETGKRDEAVEALRAAVENDRRHEAAHELLMEVHAALEDLARAEESCREASKLLSDERNFEGALRILERGLGFVPESVNLRIQRANCLLAMGQKERGLQELRDIGQSLDERRTDPKLVLGVFRKLQQLDPENAHFRERVGALVAAEGARESRRRLLRVAAAVAVVALAVAGWLLRPRTTGEVLEALEARLRENTAWTDATRGAMEEIAAGARAVLEDSSPGTEAHARAREILSTIEVRRSAPARAARLKALELELRNDVLGPAEELMAAGRYPEGVRAAAAILDRLTLKKDDPLRGEDFSAMAASVRKEMFRVLQIPGDALRAEWKTAQAALAVVGSVDIQKVDAARQLAVSEVARNALAARERGDWKAAVDALAEVIRKSGEIENLRIADLRRILDDMDSASVTLAAAYHEARAAVAYNEVRDLHLATLKSVKEAKETGDIAGGIASCAAFLARCDALRREEPRKYFEGIVERLFAGLGLDREVRDLHNSLRSTQAGVEKAREAEARGDLQTAFDTLRRTITDAQDVNFQGLALLPLRVTSRPEGATITVTRPGQPPVDAGRTPFTLHYDYQGRTLIRIEAPGFEPAVVERVGIARDREAILNVDLQRSLRWRREAGAAVEGRPGLAPGLVLLGTRAGLFRALSADSGDERFQLKTEHLSGIVGGILVDGGSAYFGGNDGEAFAVDIAGQAFRWRRRTRGPASSTPVLSGDLVAFADADGRLQAFRARDGAEVWHAELKAPLAADPVVAGGLLIAGLSDGRLAAVHAVDGTRAWSSRLPGPAGSLAPDGAGGLLVGTEASTVERIDLANGSTTWSAKTDSPVRARVFPLAGETVAVTSSGTVVRLDPATGAERSRTALGFRVEGGCAVLGDRLYAGCAGGSLLAFSLKAGRVEWVLSGLGLLRGEPAVADGILVAASGGTAGAVFVMEP